MQLVVPILNARYAINAANARWGSLYDAFYGTNVIPNNDTLSNSINFNESRGIEVVKMAKNFLNDVAPLVKGHYENITKFSVKNGGYQLVLISFRLLMSFHIHHRASLFVFHKLHFLLLRQVVVGGVLMMELVVKVEPMVMMEEIIVLEELLVDLDVTIAAVAAVVLQPQEKVLLLLEQVVEVMEEVMLLFYQHH